MPTVDRAAYLGWGGAIDTEVEFAEFFDVTAFGSDTHPQAARSGDFEPEADILMVSLECPLTADCGRQHSAGRTTIVYGAPPGAPATAKHSRQVSAV